MEASAIAWTCPAMTAGDPACQRSAPSVMMGTNRPAVERTVCTAMWFGITTGYLTLARHYNIPRKLSGYL